jgi:adenylosuccinate lyase
MKTGERQQLSAISPIDGRYKNILIQLEDFFSEKALIFYRLKIELQWLLYLSELEEFNDSSAEVIISDSDRKCVIAILNDVSSFSPEKVKEIEKLTNHDVKAVEYYLKDILKQRGASDSLLSLIHFACTSEDINNVAYALMMRDSLKEVVIPKLEEVVCELKIKTHEYAKIAMISRTHGQAASPTTFGKEFGVFLFRIRRQLQQLKSIPILAKMNGAVGNYNAHYFTFPLVDWQKITKDFIENTMNLKCNPMTTQIESHDWIAELNHIVVRINCIGVDLVQDIWQYISINYLKQKTKDSEVGSSTMPHKVNPIDFENAEGNFGLSNSILIHLSTKLMVSRLQRDLSDSTSLRSLGSAFSYHLIAITSLLKGLKKIIINKQVLASDLEKNWSVLAEPIQMLLRKYGVTSAYDRLKNMTRGQEIDKKSIDNIIDNCMEFSEEDKVRLKCLSPREYIGIAEKLAVDESIY